MKEVYIRIKGRVQGIGFRNWAVKKALEIGRVSGWVRNVENGDVEILMSGEDFDIERMLVFCQKGPLLARVDKVEFIGGRMPGFLPPIEEGRFYRI